MGTDPESSVELLERARAGDSDALDRLLERYLPRLRRWASGRLPRWARDLSDTEDLVQETVFRTLRHIDGFHPQREGALQAYLRQAVMNRIRDELRRATRRAPPEELADDVRSPLASPLDEAIGHENTQRYEAALAELRDDDREAIVARIELECSYDEMAVMLGKPSANAARVAVRRAVVRLAQKMNDAR
jgi:RNA polymerase sigma-70 factor (ECF subfamily)